MSHRSSARLRDLGFIPRARGGRALWHCRGWIVKFRVRFSEPYLYEMVVKGS